MSQQQQQQQPPPQQPLTFGYVFPHVSGTLASQPVTKEDASLMQRTEGGTQKGGAAAAMQSAADRNVQAGTVPIDAHTSVANEGVAYGDIFSVIDTLHEMQPITREDAALMQRAETLATQPISKEDASLMQRAETRTLGHTEKGGTAAATQSAADQNVQARAVPKDVDSSVITEGVTYGDIFPVKGSLAKQPITIEDAALMQRAETHTLGHTQKGGAAAAMQSAAYYNLKAGAVPKDAHSSVAEEGVTVVTNILPKETVHTQFVVAGQPIPSSALPTHMVPAVATNLQETVTIGEALEAAAMRAGDSPIEASDASAIQSAEKRATRGIPTKPGGLAATAQAAAVLNPRVEDFAKTTLSDVLMDASVKLPRDKAVTWEDAEKVAEAELRNKPISEIREGGVAAAIVTAAELNDKVSLAPSPMEQLKLE